jgi:N-acetylmuramoyl-L-alanine amidase-like protein/SH3 domain-containing protein
MNDFLSQLNIIDLRDRLPRAKWSIGTRRVTTSLTWHWNGPSVAPAHQYGNGLIDQLIADSNWQMRAGWGGTVNGADGLMYHLVFAADGQIYLTRDIDALLWHCAHAEGNSRGLALHFPLGIGQLPTVAQLSSAFRVSDLLRARYQITLNRMLGHLEWKHATACPGPALMAHLVAYRTGLTPIVSPTPVPAGLRRFQIAGVTANVRQGPATTFPIAGTLKPGTIVYVDVEKAGWIHMARIANEQADLGFVSETLGVWL